VFINVFMFLYDFFRTKTVILILLKKKQAKTNYFFLSIYMYVYLKNEFNIFLDKKYQ
jgi:hypothetical protein